jgi:hypothetical protein
MNVGEAQHAVPAEALSRAELAARLAIEPC